MNCNVEKVLQVNQSEEVLKCLYGSNKSTQLATIGMKKKQMTPY